MKNEDGAAQAVRTGQVSDQDGSRYHVHDIERYPAMGGDPSEHDRGCVTDLARTVPHPLTREPQHPAIFFGTLAECWAFVRAEAK